MTQDTLDARADAFVLGLLDDAQEAEAEAALLADATWAAAVARSRDRLLPLDMTAKEHPGAEALWEGIRARLAASQPIPRGSDGDGRDGAQTASWERGYSGGMRRSHCAASARIRRALAIR